MEEVGPPAVHFEIGDYGVCCCRACRKAGVRAGRTSDENLAELLPPVIAEVRSSAADCWLSYNHYTGYKREMMTNPPLFAKRIPDDVICKWGVTRMLAPELALQDTGWGPDEPMEPEVQPPTATNMAHLHFGTGWWVRSPRGTLEIARFFKAMPLIKQVGFQGVCTHGEESWLNPASELNYHVYAALAENADATPEQIAARSVGELYGDEGLGVEVLTAFRDCQVPRQLPAKVAQLTPADGQVRVRLNWLAFELQRLAERVRTSS